MVAFLVKHRGFIRCVWNGEFGDAKIHWFLNFIDFSLF